MMLNFFKVLAFTTLITSTSFAMHGGTPTAPGVKTSFVNVISDLTVCTGVVIAPTVVATAAHCVKTAASTKLVAYISETLPTAECNIVSFTDEVIHPDYEFTPFRKVTPDIALLKLSKPLCDATPAELNKTKPIENGDVLLMAGHTGTDSPFGVSTAIDVTTFDFSEIREHVYATPGSRPALDIEKIIEAGPMNYIFATPNGPGKTICTGDSGGPTYKVNDQGKMVLYGINGLYIVNENLGQMSICKNAYVQAFTPIAPYMDWIEKQIQEWSE